ncbi:hypothetical protein Tco_1051372, partial [Tanacetum coccineum]
METIHVKFDELTTMASKCNSSGPGVNCSNFQDSSEEMNDIPSQQDMDNLFGPLYEEYYTLRIPKVSDNSEDVEELDGNTIMHSFGTPKFEEAESSSNYQDRQTYADLAGCHDDFKSTSRGIQFLGDKLVSWSSKKQDCTAMSTTKAV